jgi:hypothetical protein
MAQSGSETVARGAEERGLDNDGQAGPGARGAKQAETGERQGLFRTHDQPSFLSTKAVDNSVGILFSIPSRPDVAGFVTNWLKNAQSLNSH